MASSHRPATSKEEILDYARHFPFFRLIGLDVLDVAPGWSMTRIEWRPDLTQPAGVMHGGVVASLIDTGIAHALLLLEPVKEVIRRGGAIVSVDLRVKYFRPVSEGVLVCESRVVRPGRKILHAESIVRRGDGQEVARGDSIYMAVPGEQLRQSSNEKGYAGTDNG